MRPRFLQTRHDKQWAGLDEQEQSRVALHLTTVQAVVFKPGVDSTAHYLLL